MVSVFQNQKQFQLKMGLALFVLIFSGTVLASGTTYNETTVLPYSANVEERTACRQDGMYFAGDGTCKEIKDFGLWTRGKNPDTGGDLNANFTGGMVGIGLLFGGSDNQKPEARLDVGGAIHLRGMEMPPTSGPGYKLYADAAGTLMWNGQALATEGGSIFTNAIEELNSSVSVADTGTNGTITMTTDGTTVMTINKDGNIGIGSHAPNIIGQASSNKILDMRSPATFSSSIHLGTAGIAANKTGTLGQLNFYGMNGGGTAVARSYIDSRLNGATNSTLLAFNTMNGGNVAQKMVLTGAGKLGIGVAIPTKALDVKGGARFDNTSSSDAVEIGNARIYWDTVNTELVILVN